MTAEINESNQMYADHLCSRQGNAWIKAKEQDKFIPPVLPEDPFQAQDCGL